jgi:hypothetical protein
MRTLLLSALLLLPSLLHAQDGRPISCRFLTFGAGGEDTTAIALGDKGAEIKCLLSSTQLSAPIVCYAKDNTIPFLSQSDRKPLATATIPAAVSSALLVFVQVPKKPDAPAEGNSWKVMVIDDSLKNFPDGGAFVANFYQNDIRFVIGEHKGTLHPGGVAGYAMPKERDAFNMAPLVFDFMKDGKWRTANESSLRFLPGMRYLIFTYMDPASGRPRLSTFQDSAPPTPGRR